MRRVLVLDAHYKPIRIVSWQQAICYLYREKCSVVEEYTDFVVRSISQSFQVPKIIQVRGIVPKHELKVNLSKKNIHKRDNYHCAYCNLSFKHSDLTLDHIVPLCKGGDNRSWLNLISACSGCNGKKGGRTPDEAQMPLHFEPYFPKWSPRQVLDLDQAEETLWGHHIY